MFPSPHPGPPDDIIQARANEEKGEQGTLTPG